METAYIQKPAASFERPFFVLLTNRCNLACKHCYNELDSLKAIKEKEHDPLSLDRLSILFEQLSKQDYRKGYLSGGEALLRPDINEIIKEATKNNLKTAIFTNGHLFTKESISALAKAGLCEVRISLNELVWVKSKFQFEKILNRQLMWIPELQKNGIDVGVIYILSNANSTYYSQALTTVRALGAGMKVQPLYLPHLTRDFNRVTVSNIKEAEWKELIEFTRNYSLKADMEIEEKYQVYGNPWKIMRYLNFISEVSLNGLRPDFCPTGPILVLDSDGYFHPCLFRYDLVCGNINDDQLLSRIRDVVENDYPELSKAVCFKQECLSAFR